jgi:glycosyltransferase involved in cell wall biosynthesis
VEKTRPALLVFADDWGRHPSSCQHLVRHLLGQFQVYWVNTIGMREPGLNWGTVGRGFEKVWSWLRRSRTRVLLPRHLKVLNPKMWPWFTRPFDRGLNRELLVRQLAPFLRRLPTPPIAVTTVPIVADLIGLLPVSHWVYYCVDDFCEWPGLAKAALREMEERLIARADRVVAVSETLAKKLVHKGRQAQLLTHGIELDFWHFNGDRTALPILQGFEQPLVVFWGVTDRRMDLTFVKQLAADLDRGTVILVGPESDPDPALAAIPRVVRVPSLPYEQLPHVAAAAHVLIMPYADIPVTRAMQPLKLKEYLATGKPVVVRDLPATRPWEDCLDLADTSAAFSQLVRRRLVEGVPAGQRLARSRLAGESWAEKARQFRQGALLEK